MTIDSLIKHLQSLVAHGVSGNAVVKSYDPNSEQPEEVTGTLADEGSVELQTDEV